MKRKKVAKLMAVVALVGAVGVGGTLAILSQQSTTVTNTFKVGAGIQATDITLDETDLTGKELDAPISDTERTDKGNDYDGIQPGMDLTKDPQVHIKGTAADCYVFAKIDNLDEYLATVNEGVAVGKESTISGDITMTPGEGHWVLYKKSDDANARYDGIYVYIGQGSEPGVTNGVYEDGIQSGAKVSVGDVDFNSAKLFESIHLTTSADLYDDSGNGKTLQPITVKALAVQATDTSTSWADAKEVVDGFTWA